VDHVLTQHFELTGERWRRARFTPPRCQAVHALHSTPREPSWVLAAPQAGALLLLLAWGAMLINTLSVDHLAVQQQQRGA
jgi:hypothetical protein